MKKAVLILSIAMIFSGIMQTHASSDVRDYFILDKGHDMGDVVPGNGWFYKPVIPYTDTDTVKQEFIDNYDYAQKFYSDHGFTKGIIDGKNNDSYFYVNWDTPVVLDSISKVRSLTADLYYSYRKNGSFRWQKGSSMPSNFVSGYNTANNKLVILYPIKNKETGFTEGFVQYPCGNLVCKDSTCSDLFVTKKKLSCEIKLEAKEIYNTDNMDINITKSDPKLQFKSLYVNGNKTISQIKDTTLTIKKPRVGEYHIKVTATSPYNGDDVTCEANIKVKRAPICGDAIITSGEQCDDGNNKNGDGCTATCKLETPTCDIESRSVCLEPGSSIYDAFNITRNGGEFYSLKINGRSEDKYYKFNKGGVHEISLVYVNPISKKTRVTCEAEVKVRSNPFCGDGIINNGETCDYNDSASGAMCNNSCEAKRPSLCDVEISGDYIKGKNIYIGATKDFYSKIKSVEVDGISQKIYGNDYSSYKPNSGGEVEIRITLENKIDSSKTKVCTKQIIILEENLCR